MTLTTTDSFGEIKDVANVAQLVEHAIRNGEVESSILFVGLF